MEIPSPAGGGSAQPSLSAGPDGRVYLSWLEPAPDSTHALRFSVLEAGGWSPARTIARGARWFVNWADFPTLVPLSDRELAAHYLVRGTGGGYDYGIRVVRSADGGATWSEPVTPHRDAAAAEHGFVSLYPAGGGALGVVWLDGRKYDPSSGGPEETMVAATILAGDGTQGAETVIDPRACDCCQTAVARTSRGTVVAYRDRSPDEVRDISVARWVDGAWTPPSRVRADGWRVEACPVNGPALAADGERVAVAWFTAAGDTARVHVAFSEDAGRSFGSAHRVDGGDPAGRVDVEMLDGGRAVVSWSEYTGGSGTEIRARIVSAEGSMGGASVVAGSSGARSSGFPRMARGADGLVFAWTEPGSPSRVRTARLRLEGGS